MAAFVTCTGSHYESPYIKWLDMKPGEALNEQNKLLTDAVAITWKFNWSIAELINSIMKVNSHNLLLIGQLIEPGEFGVGGAMCLVD